MGQISMEISEPDGSAVGGNQQGPPFIDDGAERAAALFNSRSVNVTVTFPISGEVKFPTLRFAGSGDRVLGSSVFWRATASFRIGRALRSHAGEGAGMLWQEIGVTA